MSYETDVHNQSKIKKTKREDTSHLHHRFNLGSKSSPPAFFFLPFGDGNL
jgi:hypothetical protein